jgi:O-antigen/teichoic acid export membrane protein
MQQKNHLTLSCNFSWTFIGNFIYAVCQWGMLVLLAKLGSPEMVGQFTLGLAVTAPVIMLTNLQLRIVQATDAKKQYLFSDYLGLRLIATTVALLVITVISLSGGYQWETSLIIFLIGVSKAFESISDIYYGLIQQYERMDRIAVSLMIKGPLSLLLLGVGICLSGRVLWGVFGLVIAGVVVLLGYDIQQGALILNTNPAITEAEIAVNQELGTLQPHWNLRTLAKLAWLCLPLGFVMMLISLNTNIPRYLIEQYLGDRELGIFGALAYLMVAGNLVVSALGESASPQLAKYYVERNRVAFRTLLLKLVAIALLLSAIGVLVAVVGGRQLLTLLYRPEYAEQTNLFIWLMVIAGVGYISSFLGYGMTAARYFRVQIPLFMAVTSISAIGCLWLLPKLGLQGVAIALLIAAIIQTGFSFAVILHALYKL